MWHILKYFVFRLKQDFQTTHIIYLAELCIIYLFLFSKNMPISTMPFIMELMGGKSTMFQFVVSM